MVSAQGSGTDQRSPVKQLLPSLALICGPYRNSSFRLTWNTNEHNKFTNYFLYSHNTLPSSITTRTIRLDDDLNREIEQLSKTEGTSVNFVINSALREYVEWSIIGRKFGMGSYSNPLANRLILKFGDDEVKELGKWAAREILVPFAQYQFGELTLRSFLEGFRRFSKYSGRFKFDYIEKGDTHIMLLKHGAGRKWSVYFSSFLQTVFEELLKIDAKIEMTDDIVIGKILPDEKLDGYGPDSVVVAPTEGRRVK
jgi:hypothetical protein